MKTNRILNCILIFLLGLILVVTVLNTTPSDDAIWKVKFSWALLCIFALFGYQYMSNLIMEEKE